MDHLPPVITDGGERMGHEKVHFYALRQEYSPQDFYRLPGQYGYTDIHDLLDLGLTKGPYDGTVNEFLQSSLWFSLLAQVLGTNINYKQFYRSDNETLSTKKLHDVILKWTRCQRKAAEKPEQYYREQLSGYLTASIALNQARRFISKHCAHERMDQERRSHGQEELRVFESGPRIGSGVDEKLTLSIAILGETLQLERPELPARNDCRSPLANEPSMKERSWGYSVYCRNVLRKNRWCPSEIRRMESTTSKVTSLYFRCRMKPPYPELSHSRCTPWRCNDPTPEQHALHMGGCNGKFCDRIKNDEEKLFQYIQEGKTPMVTFADKEGMQYSAHDLRGEQVVPFVALSHGWHDGTFNCGKDARDKNDRTMYACQLEMLQETCNSIVKGKGKVYVWVDTLCVPRATQSMGSAIGQMKTIYSRARTVLVWDRQLMEVPKNSSAILELNVKIRMSNWAHRLWTLQEGVLANDLHVQLRDATISVEELQKERDAARDQLDHKYHYLWESGHPFSSAVWRLRQGKEDCVQRLWEAVQFRELSNPRDETIVFANILGLDVERLAKIGRQDETDASIAAQRMVRFLDMLDEKPGFGIPSGIIFLPSPKLGIQGYEWAPETWLSKHARLYPSSRLFLQAGSVMKQGFRVQFPGIIINCSQASVMGRKFRIPVHENLRKWIKVRAVSECRMQNFGDFWQREVRSSLEPSIIMPMYNPSERWELGMLVRTKGLLTKGEVRWVESLCTVFVRLETNPNKVRELGDKFRQEANAMLFGERLKMQKWCIDGGGHGELTTERISQTRNWIRFEARPLKSLL